MHTDPKQAAQSRVRSLTAARRGSRCWPIISPGCHRACGQTGRWLRYVAQPMQMLLETKVRSGHETFARRRRHFRGDDASALSQDLAAGRKFMSKMPGLHAVGESAQNKIGPVLNGLEDRKSGTIEGFSYTDANKKSGIVWNEESFKEYIKAGAKIPGTNVFSRHQKREGSRRPMGLSEAIRTGRQKEIGRRRPAASQSHVSQHWAFVGMHCKSSS